MKCIVKVKSDHIENREHKYLVPASEHDQTAFEALRVNTEYKADLKKARNPDHHRKGFALITLIFDSQEKYTTMEDMLTELKLLAGWYVEHVRSSGELIYIPKSISFADMDQLEFETFYDRVLDLAIGPFNLGKAAIDFLGSTDYDTRKAKLNAAKQSESQNDQAQD